MVILGLFEQLLKLTCNNALFLPFTLENIGKMKKNSETSPWKIANRKLTVIDIDMRFFAKVRQ